MPKMDKKIASKKSENKKETIKVVEAIDKKATMKKTIKEKATKEKIAKETAKTKKIIAKETAKAKKVTEKQPAKAKKTASKVSTKKAVTKKTTKATKSEKVTKVTKIEKTQKEYLQEYYDLPYRYNETIVTILAQTPKRLFVYWDVSDKDKETYKKAFGDDFFEKTYPVLLVHNEELNYTFEVPINDFANSWYLDIQDSKKNYVVQLGRKFKNIKNETKNIDYEVLKEEKINLQNDFVYITDSNKLEAPNDHILFEFLSNQVKYRNVKDGNEFTKELKELVNDSNTIYPAEIVHELYTKLYSEEIAREEFGRKNPGSGDIGLPTSSGALRSSGQW